MNRRAALYIVLFVLVAVVGQSLINNYVSPKKTVSSPKKYGSIVRIVRDGDTTCSGTVVSDHVVITAAHCILTVTPFGSFLELNGVEIRDQSNVPTDIMAHVVYATPQMDQAILVGDFTNFEHRSIITGFKPLTEIGSDGQKLVSCGYPLHGDLVCTPLVFKHKENFFWAVEGSLYPGMSGGPVMLPDGTVVAVNTAVEGQLSIVSPIYNLTRSLKKKDE